ncbi:MAG: hypothetical protein ACTSR8_21090 [Promethearchaeota archaeon]
MEIKKFKTKEYIVKDTIRISEGHHYRSGKTFYRYKGRLYWRDTGMLDSPFSAHAGNLKELIAKIDNKMITKYS